MLRRSLLALALLPVLGCNNTPDSPFATSDLDRDEEPCDPGGSSALFLEEGMLAGASHWLCPAPAVSGSGPRFVDHEGVTTLVAGGSTELILDHASWDVPTDPRMAVVVVEGEPGFFTVDVSADDEDGPFDIAQEFFLRPDADGGAYEVSLGLDDGTGTPDAPSVATWYTIRFDVVETNGGALQFALNWDTANDVDLLVRDPSGEIVFYGNRIGLSGGELDLDSNAGCTIDGVQNENVIWDVDQAPSGTYEVAVNLWSACAVTTRTVWRLTILEDGQPVDTISGELYPGDEDPAADPLPVVRTWTVE